MNASVTKADPVAAIAEDVLETFDAVECSAIEGLRGDAYLTPDSIGIANPVRAEKAMQALVQLNAEKFNGFTLLSREPAVARVVVVDNSGEERTYYVCRTSPPTGLRVPLISYRSPVGAMASREVGDRFTLPNGNVVVLRQRARLRPYKQGTWDSRDSILEGDFGTVTVQSLRELLAPASAALDDELLAELLAEDSASENVIDGLRRSVITKMGLRDQPTLDRYQDAIFRLPLNSQLLILGPPGTGKTTTLIRRLGLKLDPEFLDDGERELVRRMDEAAEVPHAQSWLMFTPTDLLRQYVKEAFALEGIPPPEQRIRTWTDFRLDLARNRFGILRSAAGGGIFVLKDAAPTLAVAAHERLTDWYADFDRWQKVAWLDAVRQAAEELQADPDATVAALARAPMELLTNASPDDIDEVIDGLSRESRLIQARISEMKLFTDRKVKEALTLQVNINREFLDELAKFIDTLRDTSDGDEDEDDDSESDDEEVAGGRAGRAMAMQAYQRCVRAQARAHARKRSMGKNSRNARIAEWLGDRGLLVRDLAEVGSSLVRQSQARRLTNPAASFINGIARRYRLFRRTRQTENSWYQASGYAVTDLNPLELDVVLLGMLRNGGSLLRRPSVRRARDEPEWASLHIVQTSLRQQILVDEATDFSPIQLACMAALADPVAHSFFACGDFNQRLTPWGSRTLADITWASPGLTHQTITTSYRQSTQLNELAKGIARAGGGSADMITLPQGVNNDGVPPVLVEHLSVQDGDAASWLAMRIREIEAFVKRLPSIAVLVMNEAEVQPLAESLSDRLADNNIRAVACRDGQTMGKENDVRVFDIQHIKGLEFEAVFFVGIDRLAAVQPELFDKYLYVGTTRAATYLGMTCEAELPPALESLRSMFGKKWAK
ncbi:ATP-binding domain-containing protein [Variovorax paradoxus]|uniref:UvrD-like helicase C-terminal domain-containing protein n=1 Tax=Variovorax paradoxus (strain EPS) TaxID=595537 RepID=E6V3X9_VARPE|nr:ATP-binding domain-containing protein [Variovorax paradoxus]ADU38098.1 hypothetical protein Varpa_3924 [Variovorax paradoxus EPS]